MPTRPDFNPRTYSSIVPIEMANASTSSTVACLSRRSSALNSLSVMLNRRLTFCSPNTCSAPRTCFTFSASPSICCVSLKSSANASKLDSTSVRFPSISELSTASNSLRSRLLSLPSLGSSATGSDRTSASNAANLTPAVW